MSIIDGKIFDKNFLIKDIREKLNITRKEFSDALGLSKNDEKMVKLWELNQEKIPLDIYKKIINFPITPSLISPSEKDSKFTQIDLFAGIGGIRQGFQRQGGRTVFSSEWDKFAQKTYRVNYGETPSGDITKIDPEDIPDHDILLAGFPCQPFSNAGLKLGFEDARGTLFFNIASILKEKKPKAFMLENVKNLRTHDKGKTLKVILSILDQLNFYVPDPQVLNAYHFGSPQNRERIIIVGFNKNYLPKNFPEYTYPKGEINEQLTVGNILEKDVDERYTLSDKLWQGHLQRKQSHQKKGNGFGFNLFNNESKYTSTISARYYKDGSEALIYQEGKNPRMLTPRECARLQGFPENFVIPVSNAQAYKQFGNSVNVNVIEAVAKSMIKYLEKNNVL
ncbi:DNA (cytosine-5-)-methyltransferase [Mycoplasmopsis agassizii]|uniref:DNA (cytosine-5-)-methyltransferase n=1 Tax=Mycoplasmopsis agassizii TaxID=33922 RepID=UPI003528A0EA